MRRLWFVLPIVLAGCAQARMQAANEQIQTSANYCDQRRDSGGFATRKEYAECINAGMSSALSAARYPYPDLVSLHNSYRVALAEKIDRGEISPSDANIAMAEVSVRVETEAQRRQAAATQANAAGQMGIAALMQGLASVQAVNQPVYPSRVPVTCVQQGAFVNCF